MITTLDFITIAKTNIIDGKVNKKLPYSIYYAWASKNPPYIPYLDVRESYYKHWNDLYFTVGTDPNFDHLLELEKCRAQLINEAQNELENINTINYLSFSIKSFKTSFEFLSKSLEKVKDFNQVNPAIKYPFFASFEDLAVPEWCEEMERQVEKLKASVVK